MERGLLRGEEGEGRHGGCYWGKAVWGHWDEMGGVVVRRHGCGVVKGGDGYSHSWREGVWLGEG